MRKGRDRETKRKNKMKIMMEIVAINVVASRPPNGDRLQRRPLVPILFNTSARTPESAKLSLSDEVLDHTKIIK